MAPDVLVVIPTFNESQSISLLLQKIFSLGNSASVLVVDDSSTDGTSEQLKALQQTYPRLFLLSRPKKLGLGSAYRDGFAYALGNKFDIVVQMDGDLTHDPCFIPGLLDALKNNDIAIASRYVQGGKVSAFSPGRHFLSRTVNTLAKILLRLSVYDATSGFRAFRRPALEKLHVQATSSEGFVFQIETAWRARQAGLRVAEVPIVFVGRQFQHSKLNFGICWEALRKIVIWALGRT